MTGISDINFWSLTCGSHCSLWNLLDHLRLQDRSSSMLVTFHLSPDMFPKLSTPTEASQSSSLGFPTFPSPTISLQFPHSPRIPRILPLLSQVPGLNHQARTLLCCCLEQGKENATLKPSPSHIFLAPWEEAACLPTAFFALFHLFSHGTVESAMAPLGEQVGS